MTFSRGGKIISGSTITSIATLAGVCLGLGEWDEEVKISEEQRARVVNVSNQLTKLGYTVLTNYSSNDDWNDVLRWYNSSWRTQEELFEGSERRKENRNDLKRKCILSLAEEASASNKLSLVKRWCVKSATIAEILSNTGYQRIGSSKGNEENKKKWEEKINKLKASKEEQKNIKLEITDDSSNGDEKNIAQLEKICDELRVDFTKTNTHGDFETKLNTAREWCFAQKIR